MSRRTGARRAALALMLATLGACAVDEHADIREYRALLDDGAPPFAELDAKPEVGPIDSMLLASLRNETLSVEGETYIQSIIERRRVAAAFLPTVALSPTYAFRDDVGSNQTSAFDVPIEVTIDVNPVSDAAAIAAAERIIEQRLALLLDQQDLLLIDVARAHYEVVRAERAVRVLENTLAVQNERVRDARGRVEAGLVRPLDLSLAESQAAQTASDLALARSFVLNNRTLLGFLTTSDMTTRVVADDFETPENLPTREELRAAADLRRQDIIASGRRVEAARSLIQVAYGQYFPTVSLDFAAFLSRDTNPTNLDWTGLLRVSIPLFSAGLIEADVREALSLLRQARLLDSLVRRAAQRDVDFAYDNYEATRERIDQLRVQVRAAGDALQQADGLYQAGLATNLERLDAQDRLLSAELQLITAELERKVFYLDLLRTTGAIHELVGLRRAAPPDPRPDQPDPTPLTEKEAPHAAAR